MYQQHKITSAKCLFKYIILFLQTLHPPQLLIFFPYFYFWQRWVFVAARGLSLVAESRGYSSLQCAGFSLRWLLLLQSTGSRCMGFSSCGSRALERRLSSCGAQAWLFSGMWDLPGPGVKPVSPESVGGFLTTASPGKSPQLLILKKFWINKKLKK